VYWGSWAAINSWERYIQSWNKNKWQNTKLFCCRLSLPASLLHRENKDLERAKLDGIKNSIPYNAISHSEQNGCAWYSLYFDVLFLYAFYLFYGEKYILHRVFCLAIPLLNLMKMKNDGKKLQ
jgi:hypothetical protein